MSQFSSFMFLTVSCLAVCNPSHADETCAVKVRNNDRYRRAVDHLRISPSETPRHDEIVTVNRIVLPGWDNVTAIHWNCSSHARSYTIVGLGVTGGDIVMGEATPVTEESRVEDQPIVELVTKTQ